VTVYLDNSATTRVAAEVLEAMLPWLRERWGNPSSLHRLGADAARAVAEAREQVARALACAPGEVVFTSGGTEANNLALRGAVRALRRRGDHVVTTAVEHPSVAEVLAVLEGEGARVTRVAVEPDGTLAPDAVVDAIEDGTVLVSVMHVQNETGAIFPIEAIARRAKARSKKLLVHSDGVQALGKVPPPSDAVDLYTISGHKAHAPKGVGALRVGRRARIAPLLHGGGQEGGRRSGTEPVPGIVALGVALELAQRERAAFHQRAGRLSARLRAGAEALGGVVNSPDSAVPSVLNVSFPGVAAEPLLHALEERDVYVSTGSACHSRKGAKSPVLQAMGLSEARVASALRFSLSRETTEDEVTWALDALAAAVRSLGSEVRQ
jgi:cysteine desulfurase